MSEEALFDQAFAIVVGEEGGFGNERTDKGNWTGGKVGSGELRGTKFGISAAAYPKIDIANLTLDAARAIYRRDYWAVAHCGELPPPLALLVFDAAVNNGPGRAIAWLQAAANVPVDGDAVPISQRVGPVTRTAVAQAHGATLCAEFMARRVDFMARDPDWSVFGLGWARRLCALPYHAMTLTA